MLTFLNVGYLPCYFIMLRIPSRCMPWRDTATRNAVGRLLIGDFEDDGVVCNSPQVGRLLYVYGECVDTLRTCACV